jgi:DNA-binding FadR family transcriptional regulator
MTMARSMDKGPRIRRARTNRISDRIAAGIIRQIADGRLVAGAKLLPERDMARRHKVSRVTVREAYRSLEQAGMLSIRRGAGGGAVVCETVHVARNERVRTLIPAGATRAISEDLARLIAMVHALADRFDALTASDPRISHSKASAVRIQPSARSSAA